MAPRPGAPRPQEPRRAWRPRVLRGAVLRDGGDFSGRATGEALSPRPSSGAHSAPWRPPLSSVRVHWTGGRQRPAVPTASSALRGARSRARIARQPGCSRACSCAAGPASPPCPSQRRPHPGLRWVQPLESAAPPSGTFHGLPALTTPSRLCGRWLNLSLSSDSRLAGGPGSWPHPPRTVPLARPRFPHRTSRPVWHQARPGCFSPEPGRSWQRRFPHGGSGHSAASCGGRKPGVATATPSPCPERPSAARAPEVPVRAPGRCEGRRRRAKAPCPGPL